MTPIDFITDHLINIDGAFDSHDHGDEQKPHTPISSHHPSPIKTNYIPAYSIHIAMPRTLDLNPINYNNSVVISDYNGDILRPPIA